MSKNKVFMVVHLICIQLTLVERNEICKATAHARGRTCYLTLTRLAQAQMNNMGLIHESNNGVNYNKFRPVGNVN